MEDTVSRQQTTTPSPSSSEFTVWRLSHANGQTASCALTFQRGHWTLGRWLNGFIAGAEDFADRDDALKKAAEVRRGLEARGFREGF